MKKKIFFIGAVLIGFLCTAQNVNLRSGIREDHQPEKNFIENLTNSKTLVSNQNLLQKPDVKHTSGGIVTVIPIGGSANAYGLYNNARTALWAQPDINTVAFTHRATIPPGSGYLSYDFSTDGGWTWTNNIQVYDPTQGGANARYPQGLIYNPEGNTDPNNAYYSYFAPTLDMSNPGTNWGGYAGGTHKLDQTVNPSQHDWPTQPPYRQNVPTAMAINPVNGNIFVMEPALLEGLGNQYTDTLVITKGTFSESNGDYEYSQSFIYAPPFTPGRASAAEKIAFAPDGMTGYMVLVWDNGGDPFAAGWAYYPVLYKTIDGGETWSDPIPVVMSGPEGLYAIKYYLTDDQWQTLWTNPELVHRDSVLYTSAFDIGLSVDHWGNPHLNVTIGVSGSSGPYTIIAHSGYGAQFHIFSLDQGQTWLAQFLTFNKTFRGTFGEITEDVRPSLSRTLDGKFMFFSWIDTDFEGVTDNIMPDIFCIGYDVVDNMYTEVYNVTFLSEGWLEAYMAVASIYAFSNTDDSFTIPFVYQSIIGGDPLQPVVFKYIPDFVISPTIFYITGTGTPPIERTSIFVSQNFPNPASGITQIKIELPYSSNVVLDVRNVLGQLIHTENKGHLIHGPHIFSLDVSGYESGVYFYTITSGDQISSRKFIIN
jgi:hypothetical protein